MKIACIGKGGSGKTTICALLARAAAHSGQQVVAYDADVNQHLGLSLGIPQEELAAMRLIGHEQAVIKAFLRGSNPLISSEDMMFKTTPPGPGSRLLQTGVTNELYESFGYEKDGIRLLRVGPISESDVGVNCYHGKNGIVELLLGHTVDSDEDRILVDVTAGTDSLASGLFARVHGLVLVVEPTLHSTAVYHQIAELARAYRIQLLPVANKIETADDRRFIAETLGVEPVAVIPRSQAVRRIERGEMVVWTDFEDELQTALLGLNDHIATLHSNWDEYFQKGCDLHRATAAGWINTRHNIKAEEQIDPDFSVAEAI